MIDLDDLEALTRLDRGGMLAALDGFPEQCERALALGEELPLPQDLSRSRITGLVTVGMGGSGIAGDLLAHFVTLPTLVSHGYGLPPVDEQTLIIAVSYSGETEETLSALELVLERGAKALCLSSGGEMERLTREQGLPFIKVPGGLQPRAALGYLLLPLLKLLHRLGFCRLDEGELETLPQALATLRELWTARVPLGENRAKQLARDLQGRLPLIYGVEGTTDVVALRWKTQINENSKQPAFWNAVPELCHNELVGFEGAGLAVKMKAEAIFLRSGLDHPRNQKRIEILKELLEGWGIPHQEVFAPSEGRGQDKQGGGLIQLLSLIYLGDFVSFYLALLNGVDPTPVRPIVELKRRLQEKP